MKTTEASLTTMGYRWVPGLAPVEGGNMKLEDVVDMARMFSPYAAADLPVVWPGPDWPAWPACDLPRLTPHNDFTPLKYGSNLVEMRARKKGYWVTPKEASSAILATIKAGEIPEPSRLYWEFAADVRWHNSCGSCTRIVTVLPLQGGGVALYEKIRKTNREISETSNRIWITKNGKDRVIGEDAKNPRARWS